MSGNTLPETLDQLLSFNDDVFIIKAYEVLLSRVPDAQGMNYYLTRLRSGVSKVELLYHISSSKEGRLRAIEIQGLDTAIKNFKLLKTPILGSLLRLTGLKEHPTPSHDTLLKIENKAALSSEVPIKKINYASLGTMPLVSIIIVNMNGLPHIEELASSLKQQNYKHFEVIFVDNNSHDKSEILAQQIIPNCLIVKCDKNHGFAEANNIGVEHSTGDLILLLNNDTAADINFIQELVNEILKDDSCAVTIPKILFFKPFVQISIEADRPISIDKAAIESCLIDYKKVISKEDIGGFSKIKKFLIPETKNRIVIPFIFETSDLEKETLINISVENEYIIKNQCIAKNPLCISIDISAYSGKNIINNVGSWITPDGNCGDRGIYEPDNGQYDEVTEVDALCGCAALIRREALGNYPIFSPDFFAYFEDTELSIRIRSGGGRIVYCPTSELRHKHASTSNEGSARFRYLVSRNRLLLLAVHFKNLIDNELASALSTWNHWISIDSSEVFPDRRQREFVALLPQLASEMPSLVNRAKQGLIFFRANKARKVGIYNEYWMTFGGGELRALHLAIALTKYGVIDLISPHPFDIEELALRFNLELNRIRRVIVRNFSSADTMEYDLFVNTTHHSNLISMAKKSIYLVSFPHPHVKMEVLRSYDLALANSKFTLEWVKKRWSPELPSEVLYPAVKDAQNSSRVDRKTRTIISVGRFFEHGHNKKQLELVEAFKMLHKQLDNDTTWKLILIGACNLTDASSANYLHSVQKAAIGWNISVIPNANFSIVEDNLKAAAIYWHATGLGIKDPDPEQLEHFGMAIAEAMSYGCVPIVYGHGGPPEVVGDEFQELCFGTPDELVQNTVSAIKKFDLQPALFANMGHQAVHRAGMFCLSMHDSQVSQIVDELIPEWS